MYLTVSKMGSAFAVGSCYVVKWNDGLPAIWSRQQAGAQHPDEIDGEVVALLATPLPPMERMLFGKTQIQATLLRRDVEKDGKILILDDVKPLWTAGWVLYCVLGEEKLLQ